MPPRPRGDTRVSGIRVQPRRQSLTKKEPCRHLPPLTVNLAVGVEQSSKRGTSHRSRRINIAPPLHHTTRLALRSSRPALDGPEKHVHEAMSKHVHEAMSPSQNSPELTPLIDLFYESTNLRWDDGSWPVISMSKGLNQGCPPPPWARSRKIVRWPAPPGASDYSNQCHDCGQPGTP